MAWQSWVKQWSAYDRITGFSRIARRYFVMNAFDGTLTMLGVVLGAFLGQLPVESVVVVGVSVALASAVSGASGAFFAESAERRSELRELESKLMRPLGQSDVGRAFRVTTLAAAGVHGAAPLFSSLVILSPFALANAGVLANGTAYAAALGLAFALLFGLGVFLGRLSRENAAWMGVKMALAGALAAALAFLLAA